MEGKGRKPGGRRLVLGFDAGCTTCSGLAGSIEAAVGDRLEVRSLNDPLVRHWRREALGQNAPWAPTLIELDGGPAKAWTGMMLGARLASRLGPRATWRIMQALGEFGAGQRAAGSKGGLWGNSVSRGQFLRGIAGGALAVSALSGAGRITPEASAQATQAFPRSVSFEELSGKELSEIARTGAGRADVTNVVGDSWASSLQGSHLTQIRHEGQEVSVLERRDTGTDPTGSRDGASPGRVAVKAGRHKLDNGNSMAVVSYWNLDTDQVVLYHEVANPIREGDGSVKSRAALHRVGGETIVVERLSVNGRLAVSEAGQGSLAGSTARRCTGCRSGGNQYFWNYYCKSIKWGCLLIACGSCIPACASLVGCFWCAGAVCPYAYFTACCRRRGRTCFYCRR